MYRELREQCFELNLQLAASGLIKQTFGNVSIIDRERGVMAIKPSGGRNDRIAGCDWRQLLTSAWFRVPGAVCPG